MGNKIPISLETEKAIIKDYLNFKKNKEICAEYGLTPPKLYNILKKHNIQKKGPSCRSRFSDGIKCYCCDQKKSFEEFPCVNGKYRTICKKCHANKENKRWSSLSQERKKELGKISYQTFKNKRKKGALGEISLEEQIDIWIKTSMMRAGDKFKERRLLCQKKLKELCLIAKEKFPQLIFCYVRDSNQKLAWAASLDKIDCSRGYVDDNIQVIPLWLNSAKLNLTQFEIDEILFEYVSTLPKFHNFLNQNNEPLLCQ